MGKLTLAETINWVAKAHDKQYRKGTDIPYISHPVGVMTYLMKDGISDEDILNTALLHDVLEDTDINRAIIADIFGEHVAQYVESLSEDKSKSWDCRKLHTMFHISELPAQSKWVLLSDKVNNLSMMASELKSGGIDWDKFNKGYAYQKWYYNRIVEEVRKDESFKGSNLLELADFLKELVFGEIQGISPEVDLNNNFEGEKTFFIGEGITKDGFLYKLELWAIDQVTNMTYYFDRKVLNDLSKPSLIQFLTAEGLVEFTNQKQYVAAKAYKDNLGREIISVNIVVGDDESTYADPKGMVVGKIENIF